MRTIRLIAGNDLGIPPLPCPVDNFSNGCSPWLRKTLDELNIQETV